MLIKQVSLSKYKRLYLNNINTLNYAPENKFQLIVGRNGSGKAQPLDAKVLTPDGWVLMGDIKVGDVVITPTGDIETVIGVYPQGKRPIYRFVTDRGRKTRCDLEHLWKVYRNDKWVIEETSQIKANLKNKIKTYVPVYEPDTKTTHLERVIEIKKERDMLAQCIMLGGEDNLYITDDNLITHNTSLLNAIFNQPADKQDYDSGGYNKLIVEHNNYEYLLINDFSASPKYYFKRRPINSDDEYTELNNSRLITTQRELFLEHFRLDSDIIGLLLSEVEFTSMPVSVRRAWFNKMHVADLTYLNEVYQATKKKHRDTIGTINTVGNKLIIEKNTQISEDEYYELENRLDELNKETVELAKSFNQDAIDRFDQSRIRTMVGEVNDNVKKLNHYFDKGGVSYSDLSVSIDSTKSYLTSIISRKSEIEKQLVIAKKRYDKIALDMKEYSKYSSTETLNISKKEYLDRLSAIVTNKARYNAFSNYNYNSSYINEDNIEDAIRSLLIAIPAQDDDESLLDLQLDVLVNRKKQLTAKVDNIQFNLNRFREKKIHLESHLKEDMVVCPNCKTAFSKNLDADNLEKMIENITILAKEDDDANKELNDAKALLDRFVAFKERFDALKPLIANYDIKELIPDIVSARTNSKRVDLINGYFRYFGLILQERRIQTELTLVEEQLRIRAEKGEDYYERIDSNLNSINDELLNYQNTITELDEEIKLVQKSLSTKQTLIGFGIEKNGDLIKSINESFIDEVKYEINKLLKERWENSLRELQVINKKYNEYKMKENLIKGYEAMIEENKKKRDSYAIILDELSPQGGLIAERATSFINVFINNLNIVIRKIFNYDLIVEPCDMAVGDLTYRFKVTGGNQIRNDISNTSDGQKEVINLAFKLLAYHYCHLEAIPFINDELGKNFDEYHKQASVNYLRELMVEDKFNQFFLISHHATSYTSILDAEVVVLDPNNVVLPEKYNTSIVINGEC